MDLIPGLSQTAGALDAHKKHLEVVAQNMANAHTTRAVDGKAYQRQMVSFEAVMDSKGAYGVALGPIAADTRPGPLVHDPAHPHADEGGMVRMPNVSVSAEMVDMITASRAYQANLSVAKTARRMAENALSIGR